MITSSPRPFVLDYLSILRSLQVLLNLVMILSLGVIVMVMVVLDGLGVCGLSLGRVISRAHLK